jgi:hypothetical protein
VDGRRFETVRSRTCVTAAAKDDKVEICNEIGLQLRVGNPESSASKVWVCECLEYAGSGVVLCRGECWVLFSNNCLTFVVCLSAAACARSRLVFDKAIRLRSIIVIDSR